MPDVVSKKVNGALRWEKNGEGSREEGWRHAFLEEHSYREQIEETSFSWVTQTALFNRRHHDGMHCLTMNQSKNHLAQCKKKKDFPRCWKSHHEYRTSHDDQRLWEWKYTTLKTTHITESVWKQPTMDKIQCYQVLSRMLLWPEWLCAESTT